MNWKEFFRESFVSNDCKELVIVSFIVHVNAIIWIDCWIDGGSLIDVRTIHNKLCRQIELMEFYKNYKP